MLCENCQEREATIFYTEIMNGMKSEHSICSECAKDMEFGEELPFAELLAGILGAYAGVEQEKRQDDTLEQVVCPACRMSYRDFIQQGVFGCEECYNMFEPLIWENIRKIQGHNMHHGKKPTYNTDAVACKSSAETLLEAEEDIRILKEHLKEALRIEDYEDAARIRDEVKVIKERNGMNA